MLCNSPSGGFAYVVELGVVVALTYVELEVIVCLSNVELEVMVTLSNVVFVEVEEVLKMS